ncbi:hypothetical protein Tco_0452555 [Tanacetum coccineum]
MPTEMELTLNKPQQGVSYEVSVCIEGVEEMKKICKVLSDIEDSHGPSDAMHKPLPATQSQKDFVSKLTEIHSFLSTLSLRVDPHGFEEVFQSVKVKKFHRIDATLKLFKNGMSMSVQKSQVHKMAKLQGFCVEMALGDDSDAQDTMSNTRSRYKLNSKKSNDHYTYSQEKVRVRAKDKVKRIVCRFKVCKLELTIP